MKQEKGWMHRWMESDSLSGLPLPGLPVLELAGDRRVLIENHLSITEYGRERICIRVKYGMISICGSCMELKQMRKDQLVITGKIDNISLMRRKC